jgi:hypothetical protein
LHRKYSHNNRLKDIGILNKLEKINFMSWCNIHNASLAGLFEKCPNLSKVDLFECQELDDAGLNNILNQCKNVKNLYVYDCPDLTDDGLTKLRTKFPKTTIYRPSIPNPFIKKLLISAVP